MREVEALGRAVLDYPVDIAYTGHCTGAKAFAVLKGVMGEQLQDMHTGSCSRLRFERFSRREIQFRETRRCMAMSEQPKGAICQSCGMPLTKPDDFGTAANGSKISDYCHYCFRNGAFTEPEMTMQGMIAKCVGIMQQQGMMPDAQAQALMSEVIPKLKRWQMK